MGINNYRLNFKEGVFMKKFGIFLLMVFLLLGCQKEEEKVTVYDDQRNELYVLKDEESIEYFKNLMNIAIQYEENGVDEKVLENPEREAYYDVMYHYFVEVDYNGDKTKASITVFDDHPFVAFDYLPNLPMINLILTEDIQEPLYHPENFK